MTRLSVSLAAFGLFSGLATAALGQQMSDLQRQPPQLPPQPAQPEPGSPFTVYPVRGGVYMITGGGANVTIQVGDDGVLVVDPGNASSAPGVLAEIRKISRKPILYVMDTTGDPDHIGGNAAIAASGIVLEGGNTRPKVISGSGGAPIWSHEGVLKRVSAKGGEPVGWPTDSYFVAEKDIFFNGEPVSLMHVPDAHTNGDSFIVFRRRDVIAAGDVYTPDRYPQIDVDNGGTIQGVLDGLNQLLRLTIPEFNQEGGTFVIPGHGRLSDEGDVADYRDMVTFIRDRIQDMLRKKMTLAQIKAIRPTLDYDPLYGIAAGDVFVEQIYRSLTTKRRQEEGSAGAAD